MINIFSESIARSRYTFFAEKAREESFEEIASLFSAVRKVERSHEAAELRFITQLSDSEDMVVEAFYIFYSRDYLSTLSSFIVHLNH